MNLPRCSTILLIALVPSIQFCCRGIFSSAEARVVSSVPRPFGFSASRIPCVDESAKRMKPTRSLLDCVVTCLSEGTFDCFRVNYWMQNNSCFFFEMKANFSNSHKDGCLSFRSFGCPLSFSFLQEKSSCFKLEIGSFSWTDAKLLCNRQHPESHPAIFDSLTRHAAIKYYVELINDTNEVAQCVTPHVLWGVMKLWTGGMATRDPLSLAYSYWWQPFEKKIPFKDGASFWAYEKPDHYLDQEFCLNTMTDLLLNDDRCASKMCSLCEIDLNI